MSAEKNHGAEREAIARGRTVSCIDSDNRLDRQTSAPIGKLSQGYPDLHSIYRPMFHSHSGRISTPQLLTAVGFHIPRSCDRVG